MCFVGIGDLSGSCAWRADVACPVRQVDDSGKVQRLRKPCPNCGPGIFMATHFNRVYWCAPETSTNSTKLTAKKCYRFVLFGRTMRRCRPAWHAQPSMAHAELPSLPGPAHLLSRDRWSDQRNILVCQEGA